MEKEEGSEEDELSQFLTSVERAHEKGHTQQPLIDLPSEGVIIADGVVHLKKILVLSQQQELWEGIKHSQQYYAPTQARNAKSNFTKTIAFNAKKDKALLPDCFLVFANSAMQNASSLSSIIPSTYRIDYITSFTYKKNEGTLTGHCDKIEGWVVLFSLGCTCNFWIQAPSMRKRTYVKFQSGDCLIFNGGTEYNIFHGMDSVDPETCPDALKSELHDIRGRCWYWR